MSIVLDKPLAAPGVDVSKVHESLQEVDSARPAASRGPGTLPDKFLKGIAISVFQNSGGENSNWGRFAESTGKCCGLLPNVMDRSSPNDGACGFWDGFRDDIALSKKLGTNAFRFSIEWHRIEPEPGVIDRNAVARYHEMLDAMEEHDLHPNATLHHFVHPDWWEARGAFEKEENIDAFVKFSILCAKEFGHRIKMWATLNEPTCALVCGFFLGVHPPGKMLQMGLMGHVLLNMLKAHAAVYDAMKAVPGAEDIQIGLVHHHVEFMPYHPNYVHLKALSWWGTYWWGRDTVLNFLQTGRFEWFVPLWGKTIEYQAPKRPGLDWWGVNYYARGVIGAFCNPVKPKGELMTDMQYPLYPNGLYENLARGSALGVPMYISEIGAADRSPDDHVRVAHIESFMRQMLKAIRDGYDVRGVYYWTLMDNFEWNAGYAMKFGLYKWLSSDRTNRVLKPGGELITKLFASMPEGLSALRAHCQTSSDVVSDYEMRVRAAQKGEKILPVVWHEGRVVSTPPLSSLHLRIGLKPPAKDQELAKLTSPVPEYAPQFA